MQYRISVTFRNGAQRVFGSHHETLDDARTFAAWMAGPHGSWNIVGDAAQGLAAKVLAGEPLTDAEQTAWSNQSLGGVL